MPCTPMSLENGGLPVKHSCSTHASAYTSTRAWVFTAAPMASGAMYAAVPMVSPALVSVWSPDA